MSVKPVTPDATAAIDISSSVIQPFHSTRELTFNQTKAVYEKSITKWEKDCTNLRIFELYVRLQGSNLQHRAIVPPSLTELHTIKEENVQIYWYVFKATIQKMELFVTEIGSAMNLFKASVVQNEEQIAAQQPDLFQQHEKEKAICAEQLKELSDAYNQVIDLKKKMVKIIAEDSNSVDWALNRFCQIVESKGEPISMIQRGFNNITPFIRTTNIPKPTKECSKESQVYLRKRLGEIESSMKKRQLSTSTDKTPESSGATAPNPTETATAPQSNDVATADKPAEAATAPKPPETASVTKPNDAATADKPAETAIATKPNDVVTAPKPTETATAAKPNEAASTNKPTGGAWYEKFKEKNT